MLPMKPTFNFPLLTESMTEKLMLGLVFLVYDAIEANINVSHCRPTKSCKSLFALLSLRFRGSQFNRV